MRDGISAHARIREGKDRYLATGSETDVAMVDDDATRGRRPLREMVEGEFLRDLVRARDERGGCGVEG